MSARNGPVDLDQLAAIWVDRWLKYGGGVIAHAEHGLATISMNLDGSRWRCRRPHRTQHHWHDGWTVGRWRELQELLELIPGLDDAIAAYVVENGESYADGRRVMQREHPWEGQVDNPRTAKERANA